MVLPAGQGQVPHPSIVPKVFTINQLWNDRLLFEGDARNRWRDGPVYPAVDKELWRLGPDGSGVFWRVMRQ
ncbi:hypothetical protein TNCV_1761971 [Trichonephila clavipes]|nr:hypothetical protein TNCV_1761971 [Trichonephila clavipes]